MKTTKRLARNPFSKSGKDYEKSMNCLKTNKKQFEYKLSANIALGGVRPAVRF